MEYYQRFVGVDADFKETDVDFIEMMCTSRRLMVIEIIVNFIENNANFMEFYKRY